MINWKPASLVHILHGGPVSFRTGYFSVDYGFVYIILGRNPPSISLGSLPHSWSISGSVLSLGYTKLWWLHTGYRGLLGACPQMWPPFRTMEPFYRSREEPYRIWWEGELGCHGRAPTFYLCLQSTIWTKCTIPCHKQGLENIWHAKRGELKWTSWRKDLQKHWQGQGNHRRKVEHTVQQQWEGLTSIRLQVSLEQGEAVPQKTGTHTPRDRTQRGATTIQKPALWGGQYLNPLLPPSILLPAPPRNFPKQ